jgi:hypothetical protein
MLSIHLHLGLPSGLFLSAFLPITYTRSSSPHSLYKPRPPHPPRLDNTNYNQVEGDQVDGAYSANGGEEERV